MIASSGMSVMIDAAVPSKTTKTHAERISSSSVKLFRMIDRHMICCRAPRAGACAESNLEGMATRADELVMVRVAAEDRIVRLPSFFRASVCCDRRSEEEESSTVHSALVDVAVVGALTDTRRSRRHM